MPPASSLQRVVVIGTSCSGKTTFAARLAEKLQTKHIELDDLHWQQPNWAPPPVAEFRAAVQEAVVDETWVLDGGYSAVRDIVWPRATCVIWLSYGFPMVFTRAMRRTSRRVFRRQLLWGTNRETFRLAFLSTESMLLWVIRTHWRNRRKFSTLLADPQYRHLQTIILSSPRATEEFLKAVRGSANTLPEAEKKSG